ncbi:MAG: HPF/RaiA family ribosome-associated protein [Phycisphaerae bacterium]
MWLEIRGINHDLTADENTFLHEKVERALGEFADRITRATVRVKDVNAARGGVDMQVQVRIDSPDLGTILVQQTEETVYAAGEKLSVRLQNALGKRVNKKARQKLGDRASVRAT